MTEQRSASLQPLIGKAAVNGGPPKGTRLKPSRPPPPPPTSADLDVVAVSLSHVFPQLCSMSLSGCMHPCVTMPCCACTR